jgi:tryptophanyl-tRNA synthetase
MTNKSEKIRVLSGIRASHSSLHIGNLLAAIDGMVELQNNPDYETFYMVADLHGITTPFDPDELSRNRIEVAKDYLSVGIDPKKSVLFLQSDLSEHAELAYYLSSIVSVPNGLHVPSFEKKKNVKELSNVSVARLEYPVLMAADILLYKAKKVPIGLDQEPHLEITRIIAKRMNKTYDLSLPIPERFSTKVSDYVIPNLRGDGKMAKSEPKYAIFLNDSLDQIKAKLAKVPTNLGSGEGIPKEGGVYVLFLLTKLFIGNDRAGELEKQYKGVGIKYGDLKEELAHAIYKRLKPIQDKRKYYDENPQVVERILDEGAKKARGVASQTLKEIKSAMGFLH